MENKQDYYEVGSRDNIVVSNSSLRHFVPELGGSPLNFLDFLDGKKEGKSKYFITGSLLHLWIEDKDNFIIAEINKPTEKAGEIADYVIDVIKRNSLSIEPKDREEFFKPILEGEELLKQDILHVAREFRWNPKWGDDAIIKNLSFMIPYIQDVLKAESENKIYMTKSDSETVESVINSIKEKDYVYSSLFSSSEFSDNVKIYKELEHYWKLDLDYNRSIECKMKIDILEVDFDKKVIKIKDFKTSKDSPYNFVESFKKYNYGRQFAFYHLGVFDFLNLDASTIEEWEFEYYNIVCQTKDLFECTIIEVDKMVIVNECLKIFKYLEEITWHIENNIWHQTREEHLHNKLLIKLKDIEKN